MIALPLLNTNIEKGLMQRPERKLIKYALKVFTKKENT